MEVGDGVVGRQVSLLGVGGEVGAYLAVEPAEDEGVGRELGEGGHVFVGEQQAEELRASLRGDGWG
eukprot:7369814-Prymnesium_polylepis.1